MSILRELFRKMAPFSAVLLLLFLINAVFNLNYRWEGISFIVRVYLFLYSFYAVYIIAFLDIDALQQEYTIRFGRSGIHRLFLAARVAPFAVLYLITIIFTFITYLGSQSSGWFVDSMLDVLNGKFSNTIIYSLLLLIILKIKKDPQITIPIFLASSSVYLFLMDKFLYNYFGSGAAVSIIKMIKYAIFFYFFVFEFYYKRKSLWKPVIPAVMLGFVIHFVVSGIFAAFFKFAPFSSTAQMKAADILMHTGFSYPRATVVKAVIENPDSDNVEMLLLYSEVYKKKIPYTTSQWEFLVDSSETEVFGKLISYLKKNEIYLSYDFLSNYVITQIEKTGVEFGNTDEFTEYFAEVSSEEPERFFSAFESGSMPFKLWGVRVFEYMSDLRAVPLLIEHLTSIDEELSIRTYSVLKTITGLDPAHKSNFHPNHPEVVKSFNRFYLDSRTGNK